MGHVADRLQGLLSGALSPPQREEADAHLAACAPCREERDLLLAARGLIAPLPAREPRAGFAASVAMGARDRRANAFARWVRWAFGGVAAAGVAAAVVAVLMPVGTGAGRGEEMKIAQRLDLFEDLAVLQNRDALEEMEVVSVLHTLEARP
ncbi:MAG: zf-HC2 domain-containing protein [Myxococcales bacterium]